MSLPFPLSKTTGFFFLLCTIRITRFQVTPIVKGYEGCTDELPLPLPKALSWAAVGSDPAIPTALAFLAAEAEIMAECFVSPALKTYMETWVSNWDGAKTIPTKAWLNSQVGGALRLYKCSSVCGSLCLSFRRSGAPPPATLSLSASLLF